MHRELTMPAINLNTQQKLCGQREGPVQVESRTDNPLWTSGWEQEKAM